MKRLSDKGKIRRAKAKVAMGIFHDKFWEFASDNSPRIYGVRIPLRREQTKAKQSSNGCQIIHIRPSEQLR